MKRLTTFTILFAVLVVLTTGYIFANSIQSGEESHERSEQVSEQIQQIVQPNQVDKKSEKWDAFVRKVAHGVEFAALGLCTAGFFICLSRKKNRVYLCAPLFYTLSVAVSDEYIQSFTHRTSVVRDIVIDFIGACCGIVFTFGIYYLARFIVKKIREQKATSKG